VLALQWLHSQHMEEHFILRAPPALAARLRRVLAEDASSISDASSLQLEFSEDGRTGQLHIGADVFPAKLLDLPTKVESWKSLDDVNLVKSADIGQIIVVSPPGGSLPTEDVSVNGVTVALRCVSMKSWTAGLFLVGWLLANTACCCHRDAQRTQFRRPPDFDKAGISAVEAELSKLIAGGALNRPGETKVELVEEWVD